ncbi:putative WD repeat domain 34 [Paratrimastix pyriformis]|uniref:WD repeat domain 34 n=1 Tax=Paratrimastix pyriformis TaxID=342808 RepID=A0ABQ8UI63_9EUKA|nr:putative WD repeat domain 34 [Paratrimastix pyriformis]
MAIRCLEFVDSTYGVLSAMLEAAEAEGGDSIAIQTDPIKIASRGAGPDFEAASTQTDPLDIILGTRQPTDIPLDDPSLQDFLRDILPILERDLELNLQSHAFDGYDVQWDDPRTGVTRLHTLTLPTALRPASPGKQPSSAPQGETSDHSGEGLQCTSLAWNSVGRVLAVGGVLARWSLASRKLQADQPDVMVECSSCLMCLAAHPTLPAVIAGGTYMGEVLVWDFTAPEPLVASSRLERVSHRDPVSKVAWVKTPGSYDKNAYLLVSSATDGLLYVWSLDNRLTQPIGMYQVKPSPGKEIVVGGPKQHKKSTTNTGSKPEAWMWGSAGREALWGVARALWQSARTALSFSSFDPQTFLLGTETGSLHRCNLRRDPHFGRSPDSMRKDETLLASDPILFSYTPHTGPVNALQASPFHRNLFASGGSDGRLLFRSLLQTAPELSIDTSASIFGLHWSPHRPALIAVGTARGEVLLFDIKPPDSPSAAPPPVFALQFNHSSELPYLAVGDGLGRVMVFELSSELSVGQDGEREALDRLAAGSGGSGDDDELRG